MLTKSELACIYSALILVDDDIPITADKIQTILRAADVEVEPYWPDLFANALVGVNVKDLITNIASAICGAGGGAVPTAAAVSPPATPAQPAEEAKKESEPEESDEDMGFALFD